MGDAALGCCIVLGIIIIAGMLALINDERVTRWTVEDVDASTPDRDSGRKILDAADLVESRMHGKRRGGKVRLIAPPPDIVDSMDYDVQLNLEWLRREGSDYGVEVVERE